MTALTYDGLQLGGVKKVWPALLQAGDSLALVQEEGKLLPELFAEISTSAYAELPVRNWVHATHGGIPRRPRYVDEQYKAAMGLAKAALFSTAGSGPQG
jgi:hypothetical protein